MIAKQRFNINSPKGILLIFLVDTGIIKAAPNQPAERLMKRSEIDCRVT